MNLSTEQKSKIFDAIYEEYVKRHGLGGMSKSDLNALIVYQIVSEIGAINSFDLSNEFKITESQIKSLLERAAVKFDTRTIDQAWGNLLDLLLKVEFDVESLEKGLIRFQLCDPMLYRWLQNQVRTLGSTCTYQKSSEQVTLNLETLYAVLDVLWKDKGISDDWTGDLLLNIQEQIVEINGKIGLKIRENMMEDLKKRKQPKLKKAIEAASTLAGVGSFMLSLLHEINN